MPDLNDPNEDREKWISLGATIFDQFAWADIRETHAKMLARLAAANVSADEMYDFLEEVFAKAFGFAIGLDRSGGVEAELRRRDQ